MESTSPSDITELLLSWSQGDRGALDRLVPQVATELRRLAARHLSRERRDHTLQPTELVNELYMRLVDGQRVSWQDRAHFFATAARIMRHILVDHARARQREKRGGGTATVRLDEAMVAAAQREIDVLDLDLALDDLARLDERQGRLVELRFFGGLTLEEAAEVLNVSPATASRDWASAKAWLFRALSCPPRSAGGANAPRPR